MTSAPPQLLAYLQLFRLPNIFTALADVLMGFLVVRGSFEPEPLLAGLLAVSALLYTAGMVLNDVFDFEVDRLERPERPLPSGRILFAFARWLGFLLLFVGLALAWGLGYLMPGAAAMPWRSGAVASILVACILLYNTWAKHTPFGPVFMGLCRGLNVLLGMSLAHADTVPLGAAWNFAGFFPAQLLIAGGMAVYVAGITIFARSEAGESKQWPLILGMTTMILGIALVGSFRLVSNAGLFDDAMRGISAQRFQILMGLLAALIGWRCARAILQPSPGLVQYAIKQSLLSIIVLDAAIVAAVCGPMWALAVLILLFPAVALGRWVYST